MEIKSGQALYASGIARSEREEADLTISPEQADAVRMTREQATEGIAAGYGDSVSKALEEVQLSGRTTSFLEFYKGPLSESVLAQLLEAGTMQPETA